ncbi:hypothetical protein acdb102_19190 [Acidothermaceae bacterium B102]|nr:hypothetical protein acdb102_19190 [Acidothermaceae bacterium B102]
MDVRLARSATAAVLLAVTVGVASSAGAHGKPAPDPLVTPAHTRGAAMRQAGAMLDRAYQLGSVRVKPPAGYVSLPTHPDELQQQRWLSTPGDPASIVQAISAHPPQGFQATSHTSVIDSLGDAYQGETIELRPHGQSNSSFHVLDITATPSSSGRSIVLMQATVGWVPPRTPQEHIAADVTSGDLTLGFGDTPAGATLRHRRLSADQLRSLAVLINGLPATTADAYDVCPGQNLGLAILSLPASGMVVQVQLGGCHQVLVTVRGAAQPQLLGDDGVDLELTQLVGTTPANG